MKDSLWTEIAFVAKILPEIATLGKSNIMAGPSTSPAHVNTITESCKTGWLVFRGLCMCVNVCLRTMKTLFPYSQLMTNHIVLLFVCLDTIVKTRLTCCASHNALSLTATFWVDFLQNIFWNISVQLQCWGMSFHLWRCNEWVSNLKTFLPKYKNRYLSVSVCITESNFWVIKNLFSGSAIILLTSTW